MVGVVDGERRNKMRLKMSLRTERGFNFVCFIVEDQAMGKGV